MMGTLCNCAVGSSTVNSCEQYSTVNNASRGTVDNCRSKYIQLIIVRASTVNNGRTGRAAGGQAACTVDSSSSFLQDGAASPALFIKCKASKVGRSTISLFSRSRLQDQNSARGVCIQWEQYSEGMQQRRAFTCLSRKHTAVRIDLPPSSYMCVLVSSNT